MTKFSQCFGLGTKSQAELDFVDIEVADDMPLFLDPFAISQRPDEWSMECTATLVSFFQRVVDMIRAGNDDEARSMLARCREPNETRLGLSRDRPQGAGIGAHQADELFQALKGSQAVATGFLTALEECELMVEGIGRDKISDLSTNILRMKLAEYTKSQCDLHGITTQQVALPPYYSREHEQWLSAYYELPVVHSKPILLVPKTAVRYDPAYNYRKYYNYFVLAYLQAEELDAASALVKVLKNGARVVTKRALKAKYPCSKRFLFQFSKDHPTVLANYRDSLEALEKAGPDSLIKPEHEPVVAASLVAALTAIPMGSDDASSYHSVMTGVFEFLFFPSLTHPRKEREIHAGRKRIDIIMENGATRGAFEALHRVKKIPCAYIAIECKNYSTDVANPELDQLAGRFSPNRGQVGFLACRSFADRALFVARCRDTYKDGRGLIVAFDDSTAIRLLQLIEEGNRPHLDAEVSELFAEVIVS